MTDTDLRQALHSIRDAVPVPPVDEVAFARRVQAVTRESRRRRVRVALGAVVAATVVIAGGVLVGSRSGSDDETPTDRAVDNVLTTGVAPAQPLAYASPDYRLTLAMPDGTTLTTNAGAFQVLGQTPTDIIVNDNTRHLVVRSLDVAGNIGAPRPLSTSPVRSAVVSDDGLTVAYIDLDNTLHIRRTDQPGTAPDLTTLTVARTVWDCPGSG